MQKTKRSEVDSCTDEETDFEMQTRKSRRRTQLSRLLAMVLDTSGVSDERRMLTELVEQKLDAYTERKDELVELRAMRAGDGGSADPFYDEDPFAPSPIELKKMREEEQDASLHSKEEASLTDKIADDVSARVDEMLRKVESELSAAETAIGEKFKLLDADNDGIISLEELLNVTNVCKTTEVGEDAESELRELLKDLSDEEGFVRVEDLKRLSLEMLRAEAAEEEEMGEDGGGGGEDSIVKSTSKM
jgi:Ca2+-binding EF-hand superfamily protein